MKLFVWDFHGTLEQGNEYVIIDVCNIVLKNNGYPSKLGYKDSAILFGKRLHEYFEYAMPGLNKNEYLRLQSITHAVSDGSDEHVRKKVKRTAHARRVLKAISKQHDQILISNTNTTVLKNFIDTLGYSDIFPNKKYFGTYSGIQSNSSTKAKILLEYVKNKKYDDIIVIGDQVTDADLGNIVNGTSYVYVSEREFTNEDCNNYKTIKDLRLILNEL